MLVDTYRRLPANHLDTIPGFGPVTAAILTAKIVDPHRFAEPGKLVGLFGVFPVEASSGIDRDGNVLLFEANATMMVPPPDANPVFAYRHPATERIFSAVEAMLAVLETRS